MLQIHFDPTQYHTISSEVTFILTHIKIPNSLQDIDPHKILQMLQINFDPTQYHTILSEVTFVLPHIKIPNSLQDMSSFSLTP